MPPAGPRAGAEAGAGARAGREIRALTGLRGVAALVLMGYHSAPPDGGSVALGTAFRHGYLAVDLFFLLSGFVMALSYAPTGRALTPGEYRRFLVHRLARIYPLYLLSDAAALAVFAAEHLRGFERQLWHQPLLGAELANALLIQGWGLAGSFDGAAWSISTEWAAYLAFPVLLLACLHARPSRAALAAAASVGLLVALAAWPGFWLWSDPGPRQGLLDRVDHRSAAALLRCLSEFALGMLCHRVFAAAGAGWRRRLPHLALPALLGVLALSCWRPADPGIVLLFGVLVLALAGDAGLLARTLGSAPLHRLGVCSYAFYMLHTFAFEFQSGLDALLRQAGVPHVFAARLAISAAGVLALALLVHRWVELPARRLLRGLTDPPAVARAMLLE